MPLLTFKTKTYSFDIPDNITTMEECESAFSGLVDLQILLKSEYNQMFKIICSETLKINTKYDELQTNNNNDTKKIVNKNNNVKKIVKKSNKSKNNEDNNNSSNDEQESTELDSDSISETTKKVPVQPKSIKKNVPEIKTKTSVIKKKKTTKKID